MTKIRSRVRAAILTLTCLSVTVPASAGTLLPNGMQYFADANGLPLAAGCVYFYIPGTTSPKATYQNAAQTIANTNPVLLDAAGRAVIYGTGTYRQIVQQAPCPGGTQIWDQITADTSSSVTIYAGASSGTPNSITVTAPAFSGTDGQVINYVSTSTNTGGATLNPSSFGAVQIVRDGATGPGALTGGELVATNSVSLIYDATAGTFHILSPVTWPNTSGVPVGSVIPFAGFTAPTNYAFGYGQAVSRTTFSSLLTAYTSAQSGTISSGSPIITGLSDTTQLGRGMPVESIGIPGGATLLSCTSTTCTLSANASSSRTGTMTFFAYGDGDGSTTFNLPDYRGQTFFGRDNMGGTAANVMQVSSTLTTTSGSPTATVGSGAGLVSGMTVVNVNVPSGTTISAISGTTITLSANATANGTTVATRFSLVGDAQTLGQSGGSPVATLTQAQLPNVSPTFSGTLGTATSTNSSIPVNATVPGNVNIGGTNPVINATIIGNLSSSFTPAGTISALGSGQAHGIVNPGRVVNYIVRLTP